MSSDTNRRIAALRELMAQTEADSGARNRWPGEPEGDAPYEITSPQVLVGMDFSTEGEFIYKPKAGGDKVVLPCVEITFRYEDAVQDTSDSPTRWRGSRVQIPDLSSLAPADLTGQTQRVQIQLRRLKGSLNALLPGGWNDDVFYANEEIQKMLAEAESTGNMIVVNVLRRRGKKNGQYQDRDDFIQEIVPA